MSAHNDQEREELRDAEIARLMRRKFNSARLGIVHGSERATADAANSLMDYLTNSPDWPNLIRTALNGSADATGKTFTDLLVNVMQADAEVEAIREIERAEAYAKADPDNCRPTRRQAIAQEWIAAGA